MRFWTRLALVGLLVLVGIGSFVSMNSQDQGPDISSDVQVSDGVCQQTGVTIVVDFGTSSDRAPLIRCVQNFQGTGWELFNVANIKVEGTDNYPVGFVCRIEGVPSKQQQDCSNTPAYSEGSWSYYLITDQSGWRVSGVGSGMRRPGCGEAEGWRFLETGEDLAKLTPSVLPKYLECFE